MKVDFIKSFPLRTENNPISRLAVSVCPVVGRWAFVRHCLFRKSTYLQTALNLNNALQIIMFSDLEVDYINPVDLCNKLNMV